MEHMAAVAVQLTTMEAYQAAVEQAVVERIAADTAQAMTPTEVVTRNPTKELLAATIQAIRKIFNLNLKTGFYSRSFLNQEK